MPLYINFMNFDEIKNEIPFISSKQSLKVLVTQVKQKLNLNDSIPDLKVLCDLTKNEEFLENKCSNFSQCDITKYKYCFEENIGAVCQNNFIFGNFKQFK